LFVSSDVIDDNVVVTLSRRGRKKTNRVTCRVTDDVVGSLVRQKSEDNQRVRVCRSVWKTSIANNRGKQRERERKKEGKRWIVPKFFLFADRGILKTHKIDGSHKTTYYTPGIKGNRILSSE